MNDFILIFMGIFILLLIVLVFLLLAYVYNSYTTYTVDINKNLVTSEATINNTSKAFNKLEDKVVNELANVNKNQETIVKTVPNNLISINSNILNMFQPIDADNVANTDITKNNITINGINMIKPFTSYKNLSSITDENNYFNICDNNTDASKRSCIKMNILDNNFNFYTSNANSSNIKSINIYDSNNGILASFDTYNKNISLGSDINPAISIKNNVYNPDIIVCKYRIISNGNKYQMNLFIISNFNIKMEKYINIPIFNNFKVGLLDRFQFKSNILKFNPYIDIIANTPYGERVYIYKLNNENNPPIIEEIVTTTGYITLS